MNVFFLIDEKLVTPPLEGTILRGHKEFCDTSGERLGYGSGGTQDLN